MVLTQVKELQEQCHSSITPSRMWGYFGYEKASLNYASNMLKNESKKAGHATLGDDFIIKKVSDGKFSNLEDWKKAYFEEGCG